MNNDELRTIAQIAEELNVTRQAVYQRIRYNTELSTNLSKFTVKKGNKTLYCLQGQNLIKQAFQKVECVNSKVSIDCKQNDNTLQSVIDILKEQLVVKDAQIAAKDKQISALSEQLTNLTTTLHQQQALHAGTIQSMLMQRQQPTEMQEPTTKEQVTEETQILKPTEQNQTQESAEDTPKSKLSLFQRLFQKKR